MKNVNETKSKKPTWSITEFLPDNGPLSKEGLNWYKDEPESKREILIRSYWDLVYKSGLLSFLIKRERKLLGLPTKLADLRKKFPLITYRNEIGSFNEIYLEQGIDKYHSYKKDSNFVESVDSSVNRILAQSKLPPMYFRVVLFLFLRGELVQDGELHFYTRLIDSIALDEEYDKSIYEHFTQKEFIQYATFYLMAISTKVTTKQDLRERILNLEKVIPNFNRKYRPIRKWNTYYRIIKFILKNYNTEQKTINGISDELADIPANTSKSMVYDLFEQDLTPEQEQREAYKLRKDIERLKKEYPFLTEMFPHLQPKA